MLHNVSYANDFESKCRRQLKFIDYMFILVFPACDDTEFRCNTKRCISMDLRCDAKPDCLQGEDEIGCSK